MYEFRDVIGYFAVVCSFCAFIPQLVRAYQTRSTRDLSLITFIIYNTGLVSWLIYGILVNSIPLILSCVLTGASTFSILIMKVIYR
ncbi:MAG: hypothetical protein HRT87_07285 [Legionellales bacterium]|nr:hypothetical protein [Legionellales bacterium]